MTLQDIPGEQSIWVVAPYSLKNRRWKVSSLGH